MHFLHSAFHRLKLSYVLVSLFIAYFLLLENQLYENTNQAYVVTHHTYLASINISEWKADRKEHVSVDYKVFQEDSKNSTGLERQDSGKLLRI